MKMDARNTVHVLDSLEMRKVLSLKQKVFRKEGKENSFYICDIGNVVTKHQQWMKMFPRVKPFFAVKTGSYDIMLRCMISMGLGFDCASKKEIRLLIELGADPDKIIYANPCKQRSHITFAKNQGVRALVFDSEDELHKTKEFYAEASLVIRVKTGEFKSSGSLNCKFGAEHEEAKYLISQAKKINMKVIGVSFHVGSGCQDPDAFAYILPLVRSLFDYAKEVGFNFSLLDIGGGFPGTKAPVSTEEIAAVTMQQLDDLFPQDLFKDLTIIAEPGQYYVSSAFTLVTNIIAIKEKYSNLCHVVDHEKIKRGIHENTGASNMYFLNDGKYGAFTFKSYFYGEVGQAFALKVSTNEIIELGKIDFDEKENYDDMQGEMKVKAKGIKYYPSSIWGPTCDSLDVISKRCMIPKLEIGDWIFWLNMGYYSFVVNTDFNGFKTSVFFDVISKDEWAELKALCNGRDIDGVYFNWQ